MHSAVTDMSANAIFERLLAQREGGEIPAEVLVRDGKELAAELTASFDTSVMTGAKVEFAGHERKDSAAWAGELAPNAGLAFLSGDENSDIASVLVSADFSAVVAMSSAALGGDPVAASRIGDRSLTGYEVDFVPLMGGLVRGALEDYIPAAIVHVTGMPAGAFDPTIKPGYPVIVLKYSISLGQEIGGMSLAIPEPYLRPENLTRRKHAARTGDDPLTSNLWNTRLRVEASIALPKTTLGKLRELSVGDLIPIPGENFNRGALSTRGRQVFAVQVGQLEDAFSVRILHAVKKKNGGFLHRVAESLSRAG